MGFKIQDYNFTPVYIKGEENFADGLSRQNRICTLTEGKRKIDTEKEKSLLNSILNQYHNISGHGSSKTMRFMLNRKYYWDNMQRDIEKFCKSCEICQKRGGPRVNTKNKIIATSRTNELWECDLIGPLKGEDGTNKFLLVMIDHYSKWVETKILERKTAYSAAKAIEECIIKKHGTPERILTDNGTEFKNKETQELTTKYGFEWIFNSPGHHQTVGLVERTNQTFFRKLRKLSSFGENDWEVLVDKATLATNLSLNTVLGTSPFVFKFGRYPNMPIDVELNTKEQKASLPKLKQKRDANFDKYAKKSIIKGKQVANSNFDIGNEVYIYKEVLGNKFAARWKPGYKIKEKLTDCSYIVTDGRSNLRINKAHLKIRIPYERGECHGI